MNIILALHNINRWLIIIVGLIAIIKFAAGWLRKQQFLPMDRGLMSGFTGLLDLQLLLGIILIINAGFSRTFVEHAFAMLIAVVVAHLSALWRNVSDTVKFRNNFAAVAGALIIIHLGLAVILGWFS